MLLGVALHTSYSDGIPPSVHKELGCNSKLWTADRQQFVQGQKDISCKCNAGKSPFEHFQNRLDSRRGTYNASPCTLGAASR